MTSEQLKQFPYVWRFSKPAGYQHMPCRHGEVIGRGRAEIIFFDGHRITGQLSGCMAPGSARKAPAGKTEAQLARELRDHLRVRGFVSHRIQADVWDGGHQKAHEKEEPGTPDYICHGTRPLFATEWGRALVSLGVSVNVAAALHAHSPVIFYWEAKREKGGRVRKTQRIWIDNARRRGLAVLEAPRSVADVDNWLREQGWLK